MFYVKERCNKAAVTVPISNKNVYTRCPGCGREIQVSLGEVFKVDDVSLDKTDVFCEMCSRRMMRRKGHENQ